MNIIIKYFNFGLVSDKKKIILFDGACNFCAFWVRYVIKRDKKDEFRFSPLKSEKGKEYFKKYQIDDAIDTVVLIDDNKCYYKSTAALHVLKILGGLPAIFFGLIVIPVFIRDYVYNIIAKYRYKCFAKSNCEFVPHQNIKTKFLM